MSDVLTAEDVIRQHDLKPHPEGGWFRETFRDATRPHGRAHSTAILFLMKAGEVPRWHKVDAAELWQYGGAPLLLEAGRGIDTGSAPIGTKATPACRGAGACLAERAGLGAWTVLGCTVAPGFDFGGLELAPHDFEP